MRDRDTVTGAGRPASRGRWDGLRDELGLTRPPGRRKPWLVPALLVGLGLFVLFLIM